MSAPPAVNCAAGARPGASAHYMVDIGAEGVERASETLARDSRDVV